MTAFETIDKIILETGHNILENQDTNEAFIQTTVEFDLDTPLQVDRINQFISMIWPIADTSPINEFIFDGLASLAFPSLFPNR